MNRADISRIVDQWMIPTPKSAYMADIEKRPAIASAHGVWFVDIDGK
jgi:hypothetical protein